jgi:hypothetical protein
LGSVKGNTLWLIEHDIGGKCICGWCTSTCVP